MITESFDRSTGKNNLLYGWSLFDNFPESGDCILGPKVHEVKLEQAQGRQGDVGRWRSNLSVLPKTGNSEGCPRDSPARSFAPRRCSPVSSSLVVFVESHEHAFI